MNKYNNELAACAKLTLKPGFGEFYGGNQVHITRQNDKQLEKNNYKPYLGSGHSLDKPVKEYSLALQRENAHRETLYRQKVNGQKINGLKVHGQKVHSEQVHESKVHSEPPPKKYHDRDSSHTSAQACAHAREDVCVFFTLVFIFYMCYILHLMNKQLYYYTGYQFS